MHVHIETLPPQNSIMALLFGAAPTVKLDQPRIERFANQLGLVNDVHIMESLGMGGDQKGGTSGLYDDGWEIGVAVDANVEDVSETVMHELGHCLDFEQRHRLLTVPQWNAYMESIKDSITAINVNREHAMLKTDEAFTKANGNLDDPVFKAAYDEYNKAFEAYQALPEEVAARAIATKYKGLILAVPS